MPNVQTYIAGGIPRALEWIGGTAGKGPPNSSRRYLRGSYPDDALSKHGLIRHRVSVYTVRIASCVWSLQLQLYHASYRHKNSPVVTSSFTSSASP
jgi:hypothetical protein